MTLALHSASFPVHSWPLDNKCGLAARCSATPQSRNQGRFGSLRDPPGQAASFRSRCIPGLLAGSGLSLEKAWAPVLPRPLNPWRGTGLCRTAAHPGVPDSGKPSQRTPGARLGSLSWPATLTRIPQARRLHFPSLSGACSRLRPSGYRALAGSSPLGLSRPSTPPFKHCTRSQRRQHASPRAVVALWAVIFC